MHSFGVRIIFNSIIIREIWIGIVEETSVTVVIRVIEGVCVVYSGGTREVSCLIAFFIQIGLLLFLQTLFMDKKSLSCSETILYFTFSQPKHLLG